VLIIDRDTLALDLFVRGERQPAADGYDLASLGVRIERVDGPLLTVTWQGETTVITPSPTELGAVFAFVGVGWNRQQPNLGEYDEPRP